MESSAVADAVRAASAALGDGLSDPVVLSSEWATVLRCQRPAAGGSVIVKAYPATEQGRRGFAKEAAGLAFCEPAGVSPRLLAADISASLVVIGDLGDTTSLADLLLGSSSSSASRALSRWAVVCGRLAASTAGRRRELDRLYATYDSTGLTEVPGWQRLREAVVSTPGMLGWLDVAVPSGLAADLAEVTGLLDGNDYQVFSPGDICPDNNRIDADGIWLFDFEGAGFHSVFLDAAYLRMPFSTCWCVFRLPPGLAASAEAAYRAPVCEVFPDLAGDEVWRPGMLRAMAAWTLFGMSFMLDRALIADRSMNPAVESAPTGRVLLRYRWQTLRDSLAAAGELPALAEAMSGLLEATERWRVPPLRVFPSLA